MADNAIRAVRALEQYGSHKGAGTDWGCCAWDDKCWCGYGVELQHLQKAAGLPVTRPVEDARERVAK